jgi:site-specific recombinase XerD
VRVFFFWLEREEYIEKCPFNRTVKFTTKKQDRIVKRITEDDLSRVFTVLSQEASKDGYVGLRNLAIISLLVDSGIRRGELLSIKLSDMDFKSGRCSVLGKTGTRYAMFSDTCKRALVRYYRKWRSTQDNSPTSPFWLTEDGEPLSYAGFGSTIKRLEKLSGVDIYAHKFRHTFGSMMAQQGTNVFDLKEMMGHTSITTTQIYVQGELEHLSRVHRTNSPLSTLKNGTQESVKRRRSRPRNKEK